MKRLPKLLLALAVSALTMGAIVDFSGVKFAPEWTVALPAGVILLGLFMISWLLQNEVAQFDAEERSKIESANRWQALNQRTQNKLLEQSHDVHGLSAGHSC